MKKFGNIFAIAVALGVILAILLTANTIRENRRVNIPYGTAVLFEYKNTSLPPSETPLPMSTPNERPMAYATEAVIDILEEAAPCGQPESLHWLVYNRASAKTLDGLFFDKLSAQGQVEWLFMQMNPNSYKTFPARTTSGDVTNVSLFKCADGTLLISVSQ